MNDLSHTMNKTKSQQKNNRNNSQVLGIEKEKDS